MEGGEKIEPLVKLGAGERAPDIRDLRLRDGNPLYYALLGNPEAPVLSKDDAQEAKGALEALIQAGFENELQQCEGKTLEEARELLQNLLRGSDEEAA